MNAFSRRTGFVCGIVVRASCAVAVGLFVLSNPASAQGATPPTVVAAQAVNRGESMADAHELTPALTVVLPRAVEHANELIRIRALHPSHITLVSAASALRYSDDRARYSALLTEHRRSISEMRSILQASMPLRDLLYARRLTMSDVVAVEVGSDGRTVTAYIDETKKR